MVGGAAEIAQRHRHDSQVLELRDVREPAPLASQGRGGKQLPRGVLGAADRDGADQRAPALHPQRLDGDGLRPEFPVKRSGVSHESVGYSLLQGLWFRLSSDWARTVSRPTYAALGRRSAINRGGAALRDAAVRPRGFGGGRSGAVRVPLRDPAPRGGPPRVPARPPAAPPAPSRARSRS